MKKCLVLLVVIALFAVNAVADVPVIKPPKPKQAKAIVTRMTIRISRDEKEARLIIPQSQIKQLRAELESLDNGNEDSKAFASINFTRAQTIVSGLFMSLGFIFGGVWLARSRKSELKVNKTLAVGGILFLCGSLAMIAFANAGPPPEARTISGKMFTRSVHLYKYGSGKIKLEVSPSESTGIELIVPDTSDQNKSEEE
jgi:hypothetical protein